jgi:hypothetical protein
MANLGHHTTRPPLGHHGSHAATCVCHLASKVATSQKVPSAAPKTAPAHTSEHPKSAQNLPQTHQSHLSHYTNDASEFPWRVGCKAPKFNPLINLKNLKGEYLYAITLYQFYPQALGPFFMSFY